MENSKPSRRVCLVPRVRGVGGMVSFKGKMLKALAERGIGVAEDLDDTPYDAVLVIGGTHRLPGLWRARRRGVRVVQRLDGMNWIHRKTRTGWKHYLRAEYGNLVLSQIRSRLASHIIYQSEFSRQWWEREYGNTRVPFAIIHNGTDLDRYTPEGGSGKSPGHVRLLLVEGTIGGGYELGLQSAIGAGKKLSVMSGREVEVLVVGRISEQLQKAWKNEAGVNLNFAGQVPMESIPQIDRSAHILFAADLNPACPNSVIEALACGLPVAGFDTGALAEIVQDGAGEVVPYGGDPWKLDLPDIDGLARAMNRILIDQEAYRMAARRRAEAAFDVQRMVDGYLEVLGV